MNSPVRIMMTVDALGGVWTYMHDLVHALPAGNYEFLIVGMGPAPQEKQVADLLLLNNVRWEHHPFALEWMDDPWAEVDAAGEWLLDLARDFSPDLVHLNGYVHARLPWQVPILVAAHSCVLSWWRAVRQEGAPDLYREYEARVRHGLQAANCIIAPSRDMARCLQREYDEAGKIQIIPNGRPPSVQSGGAKENMILAVGRLWDDAKNVRLLDLISPDVRWPIWIAGGSRLDQAVFNANSARLLGYLDALAMSQILDRATIFAAPALYEPFGLSILEAAAHGCALILADIPSLRENWEGAALFLPPRDAHAWSSVLNQVISDPGLIEDLQLRAWTRSRDFTADDMAESYHATYRDLLGLNRPTSTAKTTRLALV